MALPVIAVALGAAAGGAFLYDMYQKSKTKQLQQTEAREQVYTNVARELEKGRTYALQLMVNPKDPTWSGVTDINKAAQIIMSTFEQLGWIFPTEYVGGTQPMPVPIRKIPPKIRDEANARRFLAGEPNEWIMTASWNKDDKFSNKPNWATMILPFLLPVRF